MESAVVGSVTVATIQVVLQNLLSISLEEVKLFRDFNEDLEKLKRSCLMIQNVLYAAEMQQDISHPVKFWLNMVESVAFEADDVFDELNYHVLRNKREKKVKTFFTHSNLRLKIAYKIKAINVKLEFLAQEEKLFGFQFTKPLDAEYDAVESRETYSFLADPIVLGREDDVSKIVEMLTVCPTEQVFSILPIVGMGGLGKTELARLVFHHVEIQYNFVNRIWVCVSQNFDAVIIFKKILESLTKESIQLENTEGLLQKLECHLGKGRYFLVLDDLWNESWAKWDEFLNLLSKISDARGNGIIVTTRSKNVALMVKTLPIYELKSLSNKECWSIIKAKAFAQQEVPLEFEIIGRNITKRCRGLPLAAKVVGALLFNKSKDEWLSFEETWFSNSMEYENSVFNVLKSSFDHLSPPLKNCFAYCSIYPKGFTIKRLQLIQLWMAEGFLTPGGSNDMETVGNKFFDHLVQNSLLQVVTRDHYGNIIDCNMHELVHDLAISVSGSGIHKVGRYIGPESIRDNSLPIPKQEARCVRTIIFSGKVSDIMFSNFKSLHALVLTNEDIKELPSLIRKLIHLRLLDISNTRIDRLPNSVGRLCHLQTLRAEHHLKRLPNTLKYLTCLRHLHIPKIELPPKMGKLTSLQTLPYFEVGHEKGCRIGELGNLNNLKGELEICNLERVDNKEEAKSACLFQKPNIFKLKFAWDKSRKGEMKDENVLEGLQPHPNLKILEIYGFKGRCFPLWTLKMEVRDDLYDRCTGLDNLKEIRLIHCEECEEIPMLGHLPHLKSLYLDDLSNVRSIGSSFYGAKNLSTSIEVGKTMIILFPVLERLELIDMPNLREWVKVEFPSGAETELRETVVFPSLEYLEVRECCNLMSVPSHFPNLKELIIWKMDNASALANICGIFPRLQTLRKLKLYGMEHWDSLPSQLRHLTALSDLELFGFQIEALPEWLGKMSSLKTIWLHKCKKLRHLPSKEAMQRFTRLTGLRIDDCLLLNVQRCNEQKSDDSEWSKISHIPDIKVSDDAGDESKKDSFPDPDSASISELKPAEILWGGERSRLAKSKPAYILDLQVEDRYESEIREESTTQEDRTMTSGDLGESITITPKLMETELVIPGTRSLQEILNLNNYLGLDPNKDDYLFSVMGKPELDPKSTSEYRVVTETPTADEWSRAFVLNVAGLCFLDLSHTRIKSLPSSLFVQTKLQVLMLRGCVCLDRLPTDIKNLINMKVLDLLGAQLYDVPKEIGQLMQLRELQLSFYGPDNESEYADLPSDLVSDPSIISQLQSLQALSIVVHPEDHRWTKIVGDVTKDVGNLMKLRYLQFYFPTIQVLEYFIGKSPSWEKQQLRKFKFVVGKDVKRIVSQVLDEVESKYNQYDQCLRFVNGDEITQVVTTVLTRTRAFYLDHHTEIQSLSEFGDFNFDELKFCMLTECPKIQFMIKGNERIGTAAFFPNLEHLGFHYLWELEGICDHPLPKESFKVLKYLMIHTCPKLEFIGSHSTLGCLSNLEEFLIEDCESMKAVVRENKKVKNDATLLPRLRKLVLSYLPQLVTLGTGLSLSKDKITIQCCPKLILEPQVEKGKKKKLFGFIG